MYNNQVRQRVRGLVAGLGTTIVSDPARLEAKLADLAATSPEEVNLIVQAARFGVAEEIGAAPQEHRQDLVEQASSWMASEAGVSLEGARWAAESWAEALEGYEVTLAGRDLASAQQPASVAASAAMPPAPWDMPPSQSRPLGATQAQPYPGQAPVWPQAPMAYGGYAPGMGTNTSGLQGNVPPEIARLKWNWGAFALPFWWLRNHNLRQYSIAWAVLAVALRFIPGGLYIRLPLVLAISIALGIMGHKLAWQNRTFSSLDQYFAVQRAWMAWGLPITIISWGSLLLFFGLAAFLAAILPHSIR